MPIGIAHSWLPASQRKEFACSAAIMQRSASMHRLILFDIDGTLTRTQNGFLPFNEAILAAFGFAGDIRAVVPDGNTDPSIVEEIFANEQIEANFGADEWRRFSIHLRERYRHHVLQGTTVIQALPGAAPLLRAIAERDDLGASVVTGNFEATAEIKLEAAGLGAYLRRGAYASDSRFRADLPAIARQRWEQATGRTVTHENCIGVGDTPRDLDAARPNKMKCVLVGTGRYPIEELQYWKPDGLLPDLSDTEATVALLSTV